jgi:HTH-type transcriptional regulator/antitoxin MqsA
MEMAKTPRCEDCGAVMVRDVRRRAWTYKGQTVEFDQAGWYCPTDASHDVVMDEDDSRVTTPLLLAHRVRIEGGLDPAEVKRIRVKLGLSQRAAGRVIGGGPIAFHKYEKGEVATSHAVGVLLHLLDRHPELLVEVQAGKAA